MEGIEKETQNTNVPTAAERERLKQLMTLSLNPTNTQEESVNSPGDNEEENQSKVKKQQVQKLMKRQSLLKKYSGTFNRKASPSKEDVDIMRLALEETKHRIGSGLLQFEEVDLISDSSPQEQEDDDADSVGGTITKHPQSTFYFTVTEPQDLLERNQDHTQQQSNQQSPVESENANDSNFPNHERKQSDSGSHSNQDVAAEKKKSPKQKVKKPLESPLNKIFGGNKKEKEALKHFKRFEEDFLRILQFDEEENWKCVALPSDSQKQQMEGGSPKVSPSKSTPSTPAKITNNQAISKSQENSPAHASKSYFATLPQKLSIRRKKNESNLTNSSNNQAASKTNQNKKSSQQPANNQQKQSKITYTLNTLLRSSSNKKIDDNTLEQIFDQEKEKNWKCVVLSKEELLKKEEERRDKLQKIEVQKQRKERQLKKLKDEAMQIKMIEEEEAKKKDAHDQRLELKVDRAFVVSPTNESAVTDSPSHKPFNSMVNLTRKLSMRLRRTSSARYSFKERGQGPRSPETGDSLNLSPMSRNKFPQSELLRRINSNREVGMRQRHRSAPNYRYDRGSAASYENVEPRGRSMSRKSDDEQRRHDSEKKSPIANPTTHPLLRKAVSLFFIRSSSQERSEADQTGSQEELRQQTDQNRPWFDLHNAMEGRWDQRRTRSWGTAMDRFERQCGRDVQGNSSYPTMSWKRDVRSMSGTSTSKQFTHPWNATSSLRSGRSDETKHRNQASLNDDASEKKQTQSGGRVPTRPTKSASMSEIFSKQGIGKEGNNQGFLAQTKQNESSNPSVNVWSKTGQEKQDIGFHSNQNIATEIGNDVFRPRSNITVDDISATLQVAEEDQEPIKFDFNRINSVMARQNMAAQNDYNRNKIKNPPEKLSPFHHKAQNTKNSNVFNIEKKPNESQSVENVTSMTNTELVNKSHQNIQKTTKRQKLFENVIQHQLMEYEKVLEVQCGGSSPSVPYIAAAKWTENQMHDGLGFFTTDSKEESLNVYSFSGKQKLSIYVPGCPRGLTSFTSSHVLCTSCANGYIYVVDVMRGRIVRNINRKPILKNPRYIATHPGHRSYVITDIRELADWSINMFDIRTGASTAGIYPSNKINDLEWPGFLTFSYAREQLHVSDSERSSVFVYDMRNTIGPVFQYGKEGHGDGELLNPCGVASVCGRMAVADWGNNRVSSFDQVTGEFKGHIIENYNSTKLLEAPYDLASDATGSLYLTESESNNVKVYQPL